MTLRQLKIGDRFYPESASKSGRATPIWKIADDCKFNSGHGSSTRNCLNLMNNKIESKSCNLKVILYASSTA